MEQLSFFQEEVSVVPVASFTGILPTIKKASEPIREVIERLKEAYLDQKNSRPWVVTTSFGKDSTLLCVCVWVMLLEVPAHLRTRKVYFISSDTGLEHPNLTKYVHKSIRLMQISAAEQGLSCVEAVLVQPEAKERFARKVIGHGVVMPSPKSPFRWCTDSWKIAPAERFVKTLIAKFGEVCVMTGVRHAESIKRSSSISRHGQKDLFIFPKVKVVRDKTTGSETRIAVRNRYESHPIANITDGELWDYLMVWSKFPWGGRFYEMYSFYSDQGECPMQVSEMKSTCGSSRNGCTICMMVRDDGMLEHFKSKNEAWAYPISELRTLMQKMLYDAQFREPLRKSRIKRLDAINGLTQRTNAAYEQIDLFADPQEGNDDFEYEPLCIDGLPSYSDLALGSFSLEARIFLLKNVLYFQNEAGLEFVSPEDVEYIKQVWTEELGWVCNDADITPEHIPYRGALVLDSEYRLNRQETSIPNLVIDQRYYATEHHGVRLTRNLEVLNPTSDAEYQYLYYVTTDFGGGEKEIWMTMEKAKRKKGFSLPYYWQPVTAPSEAPGKKVFWNNVTVIVSRPGIDSLEKAQQFVEDYISAGCNVTEEELPDWERIYWRLIQDKSLSSAKKFVLLTGDSPDHVPISIKDYTSLSDAEIELASVITRSSGNCVLFHINPDDAYERCVESPYWGELFDILLSDCDTVEAGRKFLLEKAYPPQVIPPWHKAIFGISEKELYWNYQIKKNGERIVVDTLACMNSLTYDALTPDLAQKVIERKIEFQVVEAS
ncbi:phosphoadenosine phosphosulfate reductase family protein [Paenibacillus sp. Y412MC10]|uniref:phosphoadenosine phosphosulfate reductase domain-containing protein n=1 Tax=Geobacillus sp. (strain Y412MC10) TaxID=481743 RepID=UPI0011AB8698|nr:phosphoadenosine phosphosulfate reductase family protein [Paenibacillus sp. Y412MC10]